MLRLWMSARRPRSSASLEIHGRPICQKEFHALSEKPSDLCRSRSTRFKVYALLNFVTYHGTGESIKLNYSFHFLLV